MKFETTKRLLSCGALVAAAVGCGDDDAGFSATATQASLDTPSGDVNESTAPVLLAELETAYAGRDVWDGNGEAGFSTSLVQPASPKQIDLDDILGDDWLSESVCTEGGSVSYDPSADFTNTTYTYDECCFDDCCASGVAFVATLADGSSCADYRGMRGQCGDEPWMEANFMTCVDGDGDVRYLLTVDGETFSARMITYTQPGTFVSELTGADGIFECRIVDLQGTCTSADESFDLYVESSGG